MSGPLDGMQSSHVWCGRSWAGLVDRRCAFFHQALALRRATGANSREVVTEFLGFFDSTGVDLLRDEEQWIYGSLRPTPQVVINGLQEHAQISSLTQDLMRRSRGRRVDLHAVRGLGELIENHLLMEEKELRPLATRPPRLTSRAGIKGRETLAAAGTGSVSTLLDERKQRV